MFEFKISYTWRDLPWVYFCNAESDQLAVAQFYFEHDFEKEPVDILSIEQL